MIEKTETPQPDVADAELVRRAQAGDEAAFGEIVRGHYERVYRQAHAILRNEQDAQDVCQDVWVTVWKKLHDFRGESRFSTWLHPIVVRRALDCLRKRRRWFDRFLPFRTEGDADTGLENVPAAPEPATDENPRRELERVERDARFERALAALPPKHRTVLALREVEGLSYEEIAKVVNCRPGTVMSRLFHARRLLLRKLKDLPCE